MALGTDGLITVVGDFDALDNSPVSGKVTVSPSVQIVRGGITYPQLPTVVPLDADGKFSIKLPASDDPAVSPNNFTYRFDVAVTASVNGRVVTDTSSTNFQLPIAAADSQGVAQLSALAPAAAVGTPSLFLTRAAADSRYLLASADVLTSADITDVVRTGDLEAFDAVTPAQLQAALANIDIPDIDLAPVNTAIAAVDAKATATQTLAQKIAGSPVNPADVGYDLVLCMGQSNMAGRGTYTARLDYSDPRIVQWGNAAASAFSSVVSIAQDPLAHHEATGATGVGPALAFARRYSQRIPTNRKVMLVPVAHGDTGFQTTSLTPGTNQRNPGVTGGGTWTPGGAGVNHYSDTLAMVAAALTAAGSNSRVVLALWSQGEADATTGSVLTQTAYAAALDNLITRLRTDLGVLGLPFVISGMVPEFIAGQNATATAANAAAINAAHVDIPNRLDYTAFTSGPSGQQNGDFIHYSAAGQRIVGTRLYDAYVSALDNTGSAAPNVPGGVTITQTGATQVTVSWMRPAGRVTDYDAQVSTNGGTSWVDAPVGTSTALAQAFTVASGATVTGRVRATNLVGSSAFSTPSSPVTLTSAPGQTTGLTLGATTGTTQALSWTTTPTASSYTVEFKKAADSAWTTAQAGVGGTSYTVTGLTASTSYNFRVTPVSGAGVGTASATVTASTTASTRPAAAPTTTAQPVEWLRADQVTSAAGQPVTAATWPAAAGTSPEVVTANSGTAPTLVSGAINGLPAVSFSKASVNKMRFVNDGLSANKTFIAVVRVPDLSAASTILHGVNSADTSATGGLRALCATTGVIQVARFGATASTPASTPAITANTWIVLRGQFSGGGTPRAALNGTLAADGVSGSVTNATNGYIALGGYGTGSSNVDYAELVFFDTFLADADARAWEQYLAATYGLTVATS